MLQFIGVSIAPGQRGRGAERQRRWAHLTARFPSEHTHE